MRSEVAAPMHTARAVLFSFLFGLRSAAGGLRDVREPLLRLRFYLLLDANPRSWLLVDPHSGPTGEACPPVPGAPGVRGGRGSLCHQRNFCGIIENRGG